MSCVVVIGGGFGGIVVVFRVCVKGYDVILIDCCLCLGGWVQVFECGGYWYDVGLIVFIVLFLFEELFLFFGKNLFDYVDLCFLVFWYCFCYMDGIIFDYGGIVEDIKWEIVCFNFEDVDGYDCFLEVLYLIYKVGFEQFLDYLFYEFGLMMG